MKVNWVSLIGSSILGYGGGFAFFVFSIYGFGASMAISGQKGSLFDLQLMALFGLLLGTFCTAILYRITSKIENEDSVCVKGEKQA
jgi:ABC-type Fe3+-siderophore transport system permease subunit